MIFQTAVLASILGFAAANEVAIDTTITKDVKKINELKKIAKSRVNEKLSARTTFSEKLEKFTKLKRKASTINLETTQFDETHVNLRGLKMKDNFFSVQMFSDSMCMSPVETEVGTLVNYCMNLKGEETGTKMSYLIKVNKKENLAVEVVYEGHNCKGIPSAVYDSLYETTEFNGWGNCFPFEDMYYKVNYLSTYPTFPSGYYVETTYPTDMCTSENMNYMEYVTFPLELLEIPLNVCYASTSVPGYYEMYSTSSCSSTGQLSWAFYMDSICTMSVSSLTFFDKDCLADDDEDDEESEDDDDYELTGVVSNAYCT